MGRIYFDNKKELVVWGIVWIIIGSITNLLFENTEYGVLGVITIIIWTGFGKHGSKLILSLIYRNKKNNSSIDLTTSLIILKYKLSKTFNDIFKK